MRDSKTFSNPWLESPVQRIPPVDMPISAAALNQSHGGKERIDLAINPRPVKQGPEWSLTHRHHMPAASRQKRHNLIATDYSPDLGRMIMLFDVN